MGLSSLLLCTRVCHPHNSHWSPGWKQKWALKPVIRGSHLCIRTLEGTQRGQGQSPCPQGGFEENFKKAEKTWRSPSSPQIHQKYIYMWNSSYRTPTECWQKTSDFPKGKKLATYLGRAKEKNKQRQKNRDGTCTSGRELWRRKGFHTLGSPFTGGDGEARGEASEPRRRAQQQGCRGQSREIPTQRISADQHSPAWEACLLTHLDGWGLGAEARASEVRPQGEDWGWLREHSVKGASAPQLAERESGKKSGPA